MHLSAPFVETDPAVQRGLIREHPLGLLITSGPGGLMANPVPFVLVEDEGPLKLWCHLARDNAQLAELARVDTCLAVFSGPQAYVSPSWYATKARTGAVVPTWNYAAVHLWGRPAIRDDGVWLRRQLRALTEQQERGRPEPWAVDDAPAAYIAALARGIVGVEIEVDRVEAKVKASQNRPAEDRAGVVEGLAAANPAMAALVRQRGGD
ncbi:MAG TPA: FMN-binding negative transcriptional regulator [Caulobacteraceae bacterium]|jgi:transcriptional regulator|nr:FMN-binding negative transcriptional regulator [Caulobacteraceae bacterium]